MKDKLRYLYYLVGLTLLGLFCWIMERPKKFVVTSRRWY